MPPKSSENNTKIALKEQLTFNRNGLYKNASNVKQIKINGSTDKQVIVVAQW